MFKIVFYSGEKGESEIEKWVQTLIRESSKSKDSRMNLKKLYFLWTC